MAEKKTKILKLTIEEWKNASRDKRELSVCRELGMDIIVLAKGNPEDRGRKEVVAGFDVVRYTTRPLGKHVPVIINRIASIFYFAHQARKIKPDIISGHDLGALMIAWMSTLFRIHKPKLVYDSHEFTLGLAGPDRGKFAKWRIKHEERFLMKRCAFSIMVNDVIADTVQHIHGLKDRPVVVRNIPNYWNVDPQVTKEMHESYCKQLNIPNNSFIVMYHGVVTPGRGVETLIQLVSKNPNIYGVVLGNGDEGYMDSLHKQVAELNVTDRILFIPAVPIAELWKYVGAADLGLILIPASCENHRLSLPNKFFENIQSETPLACPDYPAMSEIVKKYDNGSTFNLEDFEDIQSKIDELRTDETMYAQKKEGTKRAKEELCWENEKKNLQNAYNQLIRGGASYWLMLPNKFFENIQSETPVLCSNYPAISPMVKKYRLGLTCSPTDLDTANTCIEYFRTNRAFYSFCVTNAQKAKEELCWEQEKKVLANAYKKIL